MATAELSIKIDSKDVPNATRQLKELDAQGVKTESSMNGLGGAAKFAGAAIAAAGFAMAAKDILKIADATNTLQSRVNRLAGDLSDSAYVWQSLLDVSNETGASMADTVTLWSSLDQSIGATDAEVVQLTSTLQMLGKIGGASSEEMSNSLRQLGQSFAGGIVRAEEFNSVLEGTPEIWRRVAQAQSMSLGQLRAEMLDGKLTADMVFESLMSQTESVNADFEKMPRTIEMASQALSNNLAVAVAELDRQLGASQGLAKFIDMLSVATESFTTFVDSVGGSQDTVNGAKLKLAGLYEEAAKLRDKAQELRMEGSGLFGPNGLDIKKAQGYEAELASVNQEIAKTTARLTELQSKKDGSQAGSGKTSAASGPAYTPVDKSAEKEAERLAKKMQREQEAEAKAIEIKRKAADDWLYDVQAYQLSESQMVDRWYSEQLVKLQEYNALRPDMAQQANEALIALEEEKARRLMEIDAKVTERNKAEIEKQRQAQMQAGNLMIQQTQMTTGLIADMLQGSGDENSAAMQMMLAAQKALAIPSIMVSTEQAAAAAMAQESIMGGLLAGTTAANIIRAQGAISVGIVAGQAIGNFAGAFDSGGNIPSGQWGIVGERGPEIVQGPMNVTSRKKTAAMAASAMSGGSGSGGRTVINNITQHINGSGDEALAKATKEAVKQALVEVQRDFAVNGPIRKTAGV